MISQQPKHPDPSISPVLDLAHGIDVVPLSRVERLFQRHGTRILEKMLTPPELAYCQSPRQSQFLQRVGGRIAVKEAVSKALGVGINGLGWHQGIDWHDVETLGQAQQAPTLSLDGYAKRIAQEKGITAWRFSISHDGQTIMASVIGLITED